MKLWSTGGGEGPGEVGPPLKGAVAALHPGSDRSRAAALTWTCAVINRPSSSSGKDQRGPMQPTFARAMERAVALIVVCL